MESEYLSKIEELEKRISDLEKRVAFIQEDIYVTDEEMGLEESKGCAGCQGGCPLNNK